MAVQARHLSHAASFPHGLHPFRAMQEDAAAPVPGAAFLDDYAACVPPAGAIAGTAALGDLPRSDLTSCNYYYGFEPRKRPRVAAGFPDDLGPPAAAAQGLAPAPVGDAPRGRAAGCGGGGGAASTSGGSAGSLDGGAAVSPSPLQRGLLLSRLWRHQGAEIDAVVRLESERMRAALEEARRRHARALLAAAERAASGRLRAAEAALQRAFRRNAELEEKARQVAAECGAWMGAARSHEAVAAGLRATLEQLLQSPCAAAAASFGGGGEGQGEAEAEDAQSCCFEAPAADAAAGAASKAPASSSLSCKSCGGGEACVLLLPCRHLCLCAACEAAVDACPVCAAAKNGTLRVLLS